MNALFTITFLGALASFALAAQLSVGSVSNNRVVVLNLVKDSTTHQYREIVISQNAFSFADAAGAQAAINAIQPPRPATLKLIPDAQ